MEYDDQSYRYDANALPQVRDQLLDRNEGRTVMAHWGEIEKATAELKSMTPQYTREQEIELLEDYYQIRY